MRKVLAITTFLTLALVLLPSAFVIAQSGANPTSVATCTVLDSGSVVMTTQGCLEGAEAKTVQFQSYSTSMGGAYVRVVCLYQQQNKFFDNRSTQYEWHAAATGAGLDATGTKYSCAFIKTNEPVTNQQEGVTVTIVDRKAAIFTNPGMSAISLNSAGVASVGPVVDNTNTNSNTNNTNNGNSNANNGGGNFNGNTGQPYVPTAGNQDCDEGFEKVGPLCIPGSPITDPNSIANSGSIGELATRIIRILLYFAGLIAVVFVIIGGYYIMTARGNDAAATAGRKTLTNALIGLAIIILAFVIVQAITNFIITG